MTIDAPRLSQIPALRLLWQEAFGDTDEFLDMFMETAFHTTRSRCAVIDGNAAAALYWFDCLYRETRIAYLYAVATAEKYRGQGICHALMEDTHRHLALLGYEGAILVPGNEGLFRLYESMGYRTCSTIRKITCGGTAGINKMGIAEIETTEAENSKFSGTNREWLRRIDKTEYARLRRQLLPEGGVVQEEENLDFLEAQAQLYAGPGFLLAAQQEKGRLCGLELLGDAAKAQEIVSVLGCSEGFFYTPGEERNFAMYLPLKESTLPFPTYFGLAFGD